MLRNSSLIAAVAASDRADVPKKVAGRFGLVRNFFRSAPDAPHVIRELWAFAKSAYLDTPIPTLPCHLPKPSRQTPHKSPSQA
jgi:hypothetical protein